MQRGSSVASNRKLERFAREARGLLETPFRHQGRQPGVGLDCAGVVVCAAQAAGLPAQDQDGYGRQPYRGYLEAALDAQFDRVPKRDIRPGDVLLMRFGDEPQHLAIYTGGTIIHGYQKVGRVVEHRFAAVWLARTVRGYRFR